MFTKQVILENLASYFAYALDEFNRMAFNSIVIKTLTDDEMVELHDIHEILEKLLRRIEDLGKEVA